MNTTIYKSEYRIFVTFEALMRYLRSFADMMPFFVYIVIDD